MKLAIELLPNTTAEEECFLYLNQLDENRRDVAFRNETHKKRVKAQYDRNVHPRSFQLGDLVLTYDQHYDKLGNRKSESMWHGPYIMNKVLEKGAYELVNYDGTSLGEPQNGLYLKRYYT